MANGFRPSPESPYGVCRKRTMLAAAMLSPTDSILAGQNQVRPSHPEPSSFSTKRRISLISQTKQDVWLPYLEYPLPRSHVYFRRHMQIWPSYPRGISPQIHETSISNQSWRPMKISHLGHLSIGHAHVQSEMSRPPIGKASLCNCPSTF